MKLNTVCKWWDHRRVGLCKKFAIMCITVRPLTYGDLTDKEQEIVYHYWSTGKPLAESQEENSIRTGKKSKGA